MTDSSEYWHDVNAAMQRIAIKNTPRLHAPAEGESLELRAGEDPRTGVRRTLCGESLPLVRLRRKKAKVTCRGCLAALCRFVVVREHEGQQTVACATDDPLVAQEAFYKAERSGRPGRVYVRDRSTGV